MSPKYANKTCSNCGIILPQPRMIRKEIMIETGKSNSTISGATFFGAMLGEKSSQRAIIRSSFNVGQRTYMKKQTKWICYSCANPGISTSIKILFLPFYLLKISKRIIKHFKSKI